MNNKKKGGKTGTGEKREPTWEKQRRERKKRRNREDEYEEEIASPSPTKTRASLAFSRGSEKKKTEKGEEQRP